VPKYKWWDPQSKRFGGPEVKIVMSPEVYKKMHAYALISEGEIGGFAKTSTTRVADKITVTVLDVRIFKQVVNPVHTELDRESLADFYYSLIKGGEEPSQWNLWWHSHHNFAVFYSGTDNATVAKISEDSTLYSVVINKAGETIGRSDRRGSSIDAPAIVDYGVDESVMEQCKKDVKEMVTYSLLFDKAEYKDLKKYGALYEQMSETADKPADEPADLKAFRYGTYNEGLVY
jgi:hypothetical protein